MRINNEIQSKIEVNRDRDNKIQYVDQIDLKN